MDERLTSELTKEIEWAVPDSTDLWPLVAKRLAVRRAPRPRRRFAWTISAAAAVAVVALAVRAAWPDPVSAQTILARAQAAYAAPVSNFAMTERTEWFLGDRNEVINLQRWYQKPDKWRTEIPGKSILVNDGAALWRYDAEQKTVTVGTAGTGAEAVRSVSPFGSAPGGLTDVLAQAANCHTPQLVAPEAVAGRKAYVLDLKPAPCPANPPGTDAGHEKLWIDQQTFFLLKAEYYSPDGSLLGRQEVTAVKLDQPIDPNLFTFTPGPGVTLFDNRPKPAPAPGQEAAAIKEVAGSVKFPLFVPGMVPRGWVPGAPQVTPAGIELAYGPSAPTTAEAGSVLFVQRQTSRWMDTTFPGAEQLRIGDWDATFVAGKMLPNGGRTTSTLTIVREGTHLSFSSYELSRAELVQMATSLVAVQ